MGLRRRAFLRGVGGTALALPALELAIRSDARGGGGEAPRRYCIVFGGIALGSDNDGSQRVLPQATGAGYEMTDGLRPLWNGANAPKLAYDYPDIRDEVALVSGLFAPVADVPGGRDGAFHSACFCPILCGVRNYEQPADTGFMAADMRAPTSDWIAHEALSDGRPLLTYRAQYGDPNGYVDGSQGRMSGGVDGAPNPPLSRPELAFDDVFMGGDFDDPEALAAWEQAKLERGTVLDLVWERGQSLMNRAGADDKRRLEQHFDEVRALEERISNLQPPAAGCEPQRPTDPDGGTEAPWSDEDVRARLFVDLIHMAFACDAARSASLMLTFGSCYLTAEHMTLSGTTVDVHSCSHGNSGNAGSPEMADIYAWHLGHFGYLVDKLRNADDIDGRLLDNTALVFMTEGGFAGEQQSPSSVSHSTANMLTVLAGRTGTVAKGEHTDFGNNAHPAQALITALAGIGIHTDLGEISGAL